MTQNYNTIINALNQFSDNHLSVKRFKTSFFEQFDNFSTADNIFPILYCVPSDVAFDENTDRFTFRVYCVDMLQKDRSNEQNILNETLLVLRDLSVWLREADNDLNILSFVRAIPVNNFLVDFTAGWYIDFEIESTALISDCFIPFSSNFQLTGFTCDIAYVSQYLTCETLAACQTIIDINDRIDAIIISADTFVVNGSYNNPNGTLTLVRNDGDILNITGFTTGATGGTDIYVTGGTFNAGSETLTLNRNDNQDVVITGFTSGTGFDVFVTGGTYSNATGISTFINNTGGTFNVSGYYTGYTPSADVFVTGGTYSSGTAIFTNNTGGTFNVSGFSTGGTGTDTYVTGYTYNNANQFTIKRNNGQPDLNATINIVTGLTTNYFDFNTAATVTPATARLTWNDTDGTLDLGLKGGAVTLQMGQEMVARVVNKTGGNLTEAGYQVVAITGAQGSRIKVELASNVDGNSDDTLGIVTENITVNQEGFITTHGLVRGINTSGSLQGETWADGDLLYLSSTAGQLTNIKPVAPNRQVRMGWVVQANAGNGSIYVQVAIGMSLNDLNNVRVTGATNNQVLSYNASTQIWEPKTISASTSTFTGGTVTGPTIFTGGLSANTFSATTYLNLPLDISVTGGTFNGAAINFTNNTGGTFSVTGFTTTTGGIATWSQGADGSLISGTTANAVTYTQLISGGTIGNGSIVRVSYRTRTTINSNVTMRIYVNTTPDLAGSPVLIGSQNNGGATSFLVNSMQRHLAIKNASNNTEVYFAAGTLAGDVTQLYNGISTLNINWGVNQYFVFVLQNVGSTLQVSTGSYYLIEKI